MVLFATDYSKITFQNPFFFMFILTIGSLQLHLAFAFDRFVALQVMTANKNSYEPWRCVIYSLSFNS